MSNSNVVLAAQKDDDRQMTIGQLAELDGISTQAMGEQVRKFGLTPIGISCNVQGKEISTYSLAAHRRAKAAAAEKASFARAVASAEKLIDKTSNTVIAQTIIQKVDDFVSEGDDDSLDFLLEKIIRAKIDSVKNRLDSKDAELSSLKAQLVEQTAIAKLKTEQLDEDREWLSIKRVAVLNKTNWQDYNWRLLKKVSEDNGYEVHKIFDANYGQVNVYRYEAWELAYPGIKTM